jgi:ABC-type phosphate transport system permease subunit
VAKCDKPTIEIDSDVQLVAAYMASNIPAARLVGVAKAMGEVAPLLWGSYETEQLHAMLHRVPDAYVWCTA